MTAKWQYKQAYEAALVTARELRAENAKLREFATEMCKQIMSEYCSSSCKHEPSEGCYIAGCWFERRAQELGIEVD